MNVFKIAIRMVKFYQDIIGGQSIKNDDEVNLNEIVVND